VREIHDVPLPRPRSEATRDLQQFIDLTRELWNALKPQWSDKTAPPQTVD
jgi:hypothetical protein